MEVQAEYDAENLERQRRMGALLQSDVWKLDLAPELKRRITTLEYRFTGTQDVYERYSCVEAYKELKDFKDWIEEYFRLKDTRE